APPAPPGSLHGRDRHVGDVALGDRRVLHARRPAVALRAPGGGGRADRLEERRAALPGALAPQALDEAAVRVVAEAAERLVGFEPRDLVHLLVVVAGLLERPHEEPADRLLDPPPVALEPVRHRVQLAHDLAPIAGLLAHLAAPRPRSTRRGRASPSVASTR